VYEKEELFMEIMKKPKKMKEEELENNGINWKSWMDLQCWRRCFGKNFQMLKFNDFRYI
jgi:hypothetical protein